MTTSPVFRPRILCASIATFRPYGDDDIPPDDGPEAPWGDLEARIGENAPPGTKPNEVPENIEPVKKEEPPVPEKQPEETPTIVPDPEKLDESSKVSKKPDPEEEPELKKFQPHPQASDAQVTQFKSLKKVAGIFKQERDAAKAEADQARKEFEQVKALGVLDPKIQTELQALKEENEKLRKISMIVDVEESAEFKKTYQEPVTQSQESLKTLLTTFKMPANLIEQALKEGDNWKRWEEAKQFLNDGQKEELDEARRAARKAAKERDTAISKLRGPERETLLTERETKSKAQETAYWSETGKVAAKLISEKGTYMNLEAVPKEATAEQKTAIEARNKVVKAYNDETAELLGKSIIRKDPEATATLAFRAANALFLQERLDAAQKELDALKPRLEEAEKKIGKANNLGKPKGTPPVSPKKGAEDEDPTGEVDVATAMDRAYARHKAS